MLQVKLAIPFVNQGQPLYRTQRIIEHHERKRIEQQRISKQDLLFFQVDIPASIAAGLFPLFMVKNQRYKILLRLCVSFSLISFIILGYIGKVHYDGSESANDWLLLFVYNPFEVNSSLSVTSNIYWKLVLVAREHYWGSTQSEYNYMVNHKLPCLARNCIMPTGTTGYPIWVEEWKI